MKNKELFSSLAGEILEAGKIAVITHISPDGDALGSALGLAQTLVCLGKKCDVYCEDESPEKYSFLPLSEDILTKSGSAADYDLAIAVDAADEKRLGAHRKFFMEIKRTACIDHHGTNAGYADINIIDPSRASTAELILQLVDVLNVPLSEGIAQCLFTGVSTDTFHFSFNNTTGETLSAAARMVHPGMDMDLLTGRLYRYRPLGKTRLIGQVLSGLRELYGGSVVVMTSTDDQRRACGALDEDYEGIINYGIESDGVKIAILLRSVNGGAVKVSFRSRGEIDVAALAASYGGGGHRNAAGCTVSGVDIEKLAADIAKNAEEILDK